MKFVCDSCHAQYMISDDKVGAAGVKVRCKKCSHVIVVKKVAENDHTSVTANPMMTDPGVSAPSAGEPFGGLGLDEIGQAFDSVLSGGPSSSDSAPNPFNALIEQGGSSPYAASAPEGNQATTVMNTRELAGLAAQTESSNKLPDGLKADAALNGAKGAVNGHANGKVNGTSDIPQTDWYIAIDDEQQGPVTLDFVKKAWEEGKVTTDSLCWRNGYADWCPLSTVPDLVKVLTPIPVPRKSAISPLPPDAEKPAGATATGSQTAWSGGPAPSAVPDPDAIDWKPAAASALASLVQDEIAALTKPTPKKTEEPVGVGEGTRPRARGLLDLQDEPVSSKSALTEEPPRGLMGDSVPVLAAAPSAGSALDGMSAPPPPPREQSSDPQIEVRSPRLPASRPPMESQRVDRDDVPVYPPPAQYVAPPQQQSGGNAKYILGAGGLVAVCVTVVTIAWMFKPPAQQPNEVAENRPAPVAAPIAAPTPAPAPVAVAPVTPPVAAPTPTPAPVAVADATKPPVTPTPAPAPAAVAAAPKAADDEVDPGTGKKHHKKHHKGAGGEEAEGSPQVASADPTPAPEPKAALEPRAAPPSGPPPSKVDLLSTGSKSKIDKDFDSLLGGDPAPADAPAPTPKKEKKAAVYIPGDMAASVPVQLTQGDIMPVVASHKAAIKACGESDPNLSGNKVLMHWVIGNSGSTQGVKCASDDYKSSPGSKCLASEIRHWKFPQFSGAPMPIDFPFKF